MKKMLFAVAPLVVAGGSGEVLSGPLYIPIDIGTLGGASSFSAGLTATGRVIGSRQTATGARHAFS